MGGRVVRFHHSAGKWVKNLLVPIREADFQILVLSVFSLTQAEGLITGTMVKMFTIAGPVIVSGTVASALYGLVLVLLGSGG
ncbi:MAG: SpoVA/SpoVAEb family sporulation membrane protein [Oscillospiraceae bacterium]|nr:SpoVA/SpoVAEb family sporulation membrane protein [Oscillospiraceae bacterium]